MKFELGAMSVGDILDRALKLFLARLPTFYTINLIVLSPVLILQCALPLFLQGQPSNAQLAWLFGSSALVLLLGLILSSFGSAAILYVIAQEFVDRQAGLGPAFAFAARRFPSLFAVSFLYGLLVFLGSLFCCIPGIVFLIWFAFAGQVVVVEGLGPIQAFARSQALGSGFRWRFLGIFGLFVVLQLGCGIVLNILKVLLPGFEIVPIQGGGFEPVLKSYPNHLIQTVLSFLITTVPQTYYNICVTLFYFDLRIRKEGFDLELAASKQSGVAP